MKCPFCSHVESKVIDSRPTDEDKSIRRRRECLQCGKRFTTYEVIETIPLIVIKKDKSREPFNKEKLLNGFIRASEKLPVAYTDLVQAADEIEAALYNLLEHEVTSVKIGELAMEKLKDIDEVAYVRFASVYREFKDVNSFREELNKLFTSK